ncbi:spinster family MFS transporter [Sphingomonas soli]|uniref:spinster family MFS transporter n=1 Tax=Sphingomonas soli TaxID=266127 RepID=UPI000A058876|nr:MFS transporter [Sphingomonas soli]
MQASIKAPVAPVSRQAWLTLFLLYLLNTMLVLDKIVFTVLMEPLKNEFDLSDLQLGLVTGAGYAVFFGLASIPFGILADRYNRRNLAASCLTFWSAMTALCGAATTFPALLAARLGVGVGEAGGGPASLSMISDLFEHRRRATAMAIFSLGSPTAALINLTMNTKVAHDYGWRTALYANCVIGLVLAFVIWLAVKEPKRAPLPADASGKSGTTLKATLKHIWATPSLRMMICGGAIAYTVVAGMSAFNFSYLVRVHKVDLHEVGPVLGIAISVAGVIGLFTSGRLADVLARRDERWRAWVPAITTLASIPFGMGAFLTSSWTVAVLCTAGLAATVTLWLAPGYALTQSLAPERMRGKIGAILFLLANLVGFGIGPPVVGMLSDLYASNGFAVPLRWALITGLFVNSISALLFLLAARTVREDLKRANV